MLKLYAVECGMKSQYLRRECLSSTANFRGTPFGADGHDLGKGLKSLRIRASEVSPPPRVRMHSSTGQREEIAIHSAHQACRYGANLVRQDRDRLEDWLDDLERWVQEN